MNCKLVRVKDTIKNQGIVSFKCVRCGKKASFDRVFFSDYCNDSTEIAATFLKRCATNTDSQAPPPILTRVNTYVKALKKWVKAGRPTRNDEEVKEIFENHCKECDFFDSEYNRCNTCGCKVAPEEASVLEQLKFTGINAMMNKIRMKTEYCPLGLWGEDPLNNESA